MSKVYKIYNKKTQAMEETIHISFKEKKNDIDHNVRELEEDMENLSLNNDIHNKQFLQIATRESNDDMTTMFEPSHPQHVSDHIPEDSEGSLVKRRYTNARDLRAVSQNQIIGEPSKGIRTRSSFRTESNMALI